MCYRCLREYFILTLLSGYLMHVDIKESSGYKILVLSGQISHLKDSISLKSVINTLLEEKVTKIALSLKSLDYIDSAALNVFIYARNQVQKTGGDFVLLEPNEYVMDVISVVGLKDFFNILADKELLKNRAS